MKTEKSGVSSFFSFTGKMYVNLIHIEKKYELKGIEYKLK